MVLSGGVNTLFLTTRLSGGAGATLDLNGNVQSTAQSSSPVNA
jgi:hypothetical protein